MSPLLDQLSRYADYHRDRRNVLTHFVGIPMIVLGVAILLGRPTVELGGWLLSPALIVAIVATLYYLRLDLRFGLVMGLLLLVCVAVANKFAQGDQLIRFGWGVGLFVVGWAFQFVGHVFEGRKPAFVDDLMGLVIGPLFVVAEVGFAFGLRRDLKAEILARLR